MKRWWLLILLLLSIGLNLGMLAPRLWRGGTAALVEGSPGEGLPLDPNIDEEKRLPPIFHRMADELRLAGEERRFFLALQRHFVEQTREARVRTARFQAEMRQELVAAQPDRAHVDHLLEELTIAHADLERAFVTNLLDTRELLEGHRERLFMRMMRRLWQAHSDPRRRPQGRWQPEASGRRPETRRDSPQRLPKREGAP